MLSSILSNMLGNTLANKQKMLYRYSRKSIPTFVEHRWIDQIWLIGEWYHTHIIIDIIEQICLFVTINTKWRIVRRGQKPDIRFNMRTLPANNNTLLSKKTFKVYLSLSIQLLSYNLVLVDNKLYMLKTSFILGTLKYFH